MAPERMEELFCSTGQSDVRSINELRKEIVANAKKANLALTKKRRERLEKFESTLQRKINVTQ